MRKIKWGVLGTAGILSCSARGMKKAEHCELYAIAGRSAKKVKIFQRLYGFEKGYDSYDALLEDEQVEAVYIPLSNDVHFEWTKKALQHKKHVLCEKPLVPSAEQAEELFEIAKENGEFLMEAFAYQHSPFMEALEQEVKSGIIGDVCFIDTGFFITERDQKNFRLFRDKFGGSTYDLGVYTASFLLRILGKEPVKIHATADFSEQNIDLVTSAHLEYEDNVRATISCGMVLAKGASTRYDRFEIQGTKGAIHAKKFFYNAEGVLSYEVEIYKGESEIKEIEVPDNYQLEMEQFSLCVLGEAVPAVTKDFSLANARTIDKILEAIHY